MSAEPAARPAARPAGAGDRRLAGGSGVSQRTLGLACLGLTAIIWGANWSVVKFMLARMPPFAMRSLSGLLGALVLFAAAGVRGERMLPPLAFLPRLMLDSMLNFGLWMGLAAYSLYWLPAGEAAIIAYTLPIWAALMAWPLLGERPTARRTGGLVAGFAGVAVLLGDQPMAASLDQWPGVAMVLFASVSFAFGMVMAKRRWHPLSPLVDTGWQILLGSIPLGLLSLAFEHWAPGRVDGLRWAVLVYMGLVAVAAAYLAWFRALALLPAATAGVGSLLVPVFAVFFAAALLGEPLGLRQLLALALTLTGIALAALA